MLSVTLFSQFLTFLFSKENSVCDPQLSPLLPEDMKRPLAQYWISSSHNTYVSSTVGRKPPHSFSRVSSLKREKLTGFERQFIPPPDASDKTFFHLKEIKGLISRTGAGEKCTLIVSCRRSERLTPKAVVQVRASAEGRTLL